MSSSSTGETHPFPTAAQLRQWLIDPAGTVVDFETRLKSRWLAGMLLLAIPFGMVMALIPPLAESRSLWQHTHVPATLGLSLFLLYCYYLARTGQYRQSAFLAIVAAYLVIYLPSPLNGRPEQLLSDAIFLIVPLVVSSILLSPRVTTIFLAVNVILLLVIPQVYPAVTIGLVLGQPLSLMLVTFTLVSFGAYLRDALEKHHTSTLQAEIVERQQVEDLLRISLLEKETLLKEIHHRVKNNLQVIASLLSLQAMSLGDAQVVAAITDSQHRVRTMALIHEQLHLSSELSYIDLKKYTEELVDYLLQSHQGLNENVDLTITIADIHLSIDAAIPCGLIINELVTNALKHAFPDGSSGTICVAMHQDRSQNYTLTVSDDGVGLPHEIDIGQTPSLGLRLVHRLTTQLGGTLHLESADGSTFTVSFTDRTGKGASYG